MPHCRFRNVESAKSWNSHDFSLALVQWKGEATEVDAATIESEVDQILTAVDFDKNGYIEYSGKQSEILRHRARSRFGSLA